MSDEQPGKHLCRCTCIIYVVTMVIFMGDSILRRMLSDVYGWKPYRSGNGKFSLQFCVGGQTCQQLRRRLKKGQKVGSMWNHELSGQDVVLMIGTNCVLRKLMSEYGHVRRTLAWLIADLRRYGVKKILFCTLPPLFRHDQQTVLAMFNGAISDLCKQHPDFLVFLDVHAQFSVHSSFIRFFNADLIHPNQQGSELIWNTIQGYLS